MRFCEAEMACYRQVLDSIRQVRALTLALQQLENRVDELAQPKAVLASLQAAIGHGLDDAEFMRQVHYHPGSA